MVNENIKLTESENQTRMELSYEWVARYNDGTELKQYDDEKQLVHHFGHIDQEKIHEFEIIPTKNNLYPVKVDLKTGLFYVDNNVLVAIRQGDIEVDIGFWLAGKKLTSTWGDKAKLIYVRHVRRNFSPGPNGFSMDTSIVYEIGWEAVIDGKHAKQSITVNEQGTFEIPLSFEQEGFKLI